MPRYAKDLIREVHEYKDTDCNRENSVKAMLEQAKQ